MIEHRFGDKLVKIDGSHAQHVVDHIKHVMSADAHKELFHDAHFHGHAPLDYRADGQWHHTELVKNHDGTYSIEA